MKKFLLLSISFSCISTNTGYYTFPQDTFKEYNYQPIELTVELPNNTTKDEIADEIADVRRITEEILKSTPHKKTEVKSNNGESIVIEEHLKNDRVIVVIKTPTSIFIIVFKKELPENFFATLFKGGLTDSNLYETITTIGGYILFNELSRELL